MKNYLLKALLICSTPFFYGALYGQQLLNPSKANEFVLEVYADCPQYQNQDQINFATDYLQRTRIHSIALGEYPECPLLSSAGRKDKCNPSMNYDTATFTIETFNPLKYLFNYYSTASSYYRVDGMPYIIEILPKP